MKPSMMKKKLSFLDKEVRDNKMEIEFRKQSNSDLQKKLRDAESRLIKDPNGNIIDLTYDSYKTILHKATEYDI